MIKKGYGTRASGLISMVISVTTLFGLQMDPETLVNLSNQFGSTAIGTTVLAWLGVEYYYDRATSNNSDLQVDDPGLTRQDLQAPAAVDTLQVRSTKLSDHELENLIDQMEVSE